MKNRLLRILIDVINGAIFVGIFAAILGTGIGLIVLYSVHPVICIIVIAPAIFWIIGQVMKFV